MLAIKFRLPEGLETVWVTLTVDGEMTFHHGIPSLRELQSAVGGLVEVVAFELAGSAADMWVAEEGKLLDQPQRNWKADVVCPVVARYGDWIAGDVAFTGSPDAQGATQGLTQAQVHELHRIDQNVRVILLDPRGATGRVIE